MFADDNGITYKLNKKDLTASIVNSHDIRGSIEIPHSFFYQSQEYTITVLDSNSFGSQKSITLVTFAKDSELNRIEKKSFTNSSLEGICIPSNVNFIGDRTFSWCNELFSIEFSSNSKLESIGIDAFSFTSIESIIIPPSVKEIGERAFRNCKNLKTIEFSANSKLHSISKEMFSNSFLENINIPSSVTSIEENAFYNCEYLKSINISKDSQLVSIGKSALFKTSIENIFIPPNLKELKEGWCNEINELKMISVSSKNSHFSCFDEKFLTGKSNQNSEIYDVLIFSCRDVEFADIPSQIKEISSFSFSKCQKMKLINFSKN